MKLIKQIILNLKVNLSFFYAVIFLLKFNVKNELIYKFTLPFMVGN